MHFEHTKTGMVRRSILFLCVALATDLVGESVLLNFTKTFPFDIPEQTQESTLPRGEGDGGFQRCYAE